MADLLLHLVLLIAMPDHAQAPAGDQQLPHDQHGQHHRSSYADQGDSGIAALSPAELAQLENGDGMGLARAAELNGYPGPKHVLELADPLGLSPEQKAEIERIRQGMTREAARLGAEIIDKERLLDRRFRHRHIDDPALEQITAEIGALYGQLRFAHLRAHLTTAELLTEEQIGHYDQLRGYGRRS